MSADGSRTNPLRYGVAACQIDLPNPTRRGEIAQRVEHMLGMARMAVEGYAPFFPVKLLVFPEFAHAAPVYQRTFFPPGLHTSERNLTVKKNQRAIDAAQRRLPCEKS